MILKACLRFASLSIFLIAITEGAIPTNDNLVDFFPSTDGDGLNVKWTDKVYSIARFNETLADDTMMIETNIVLRFQTDVPVHARYDSNNTDLTLDHFLNVTTRYMDKGMKLVFDHLEPLEPSMKLIKKYGSDLKGPLWLSADIVHGPNAPNPPVAPQDFINIANRYFNRTTLSLGFITSWGPSGLAERMYTWYMIFDILSYSYPLDPQPVTFLFRAVWCKTSWPKLSWLLGLRESFSITVWSRDTDVVDVGGLVDLRAYGDMKRIFYDLPDYQKQMFLDALDNSTITPSPPLETPWDRDQWVGFENQDGRNFAFLSSEGLGISGDAPRAALVHSKRQYMPEMCGATAMVLRGQVQFVGRDVDTEEATSLEIFIRSGSLLDNEEERNDILAGNRDPSGLKFSIFSNGTMITETCVFDGAASMGCYYVKILDTLDGSYEIQKTVRTCADAPEDDPLDGSTDRCGVTARNPPDGHQEYYVTVIGGDGGIILEDLTVEGSQRVDCPTDPNENTPDPNETTPDPNETTPDPNETTPVSKGNSVLISHGLSSLLIISMMAMVSVSSMYPFSF